MRQRSCVRFGETERVSAHTASTSLQFDVIVPRDRAGASEFLRPEDRQAFLQGREQPFRDPVVVETIELSDDGAQATLGIAFDLMTPVASSPGRSSRSGPPWTANGWPNPAKPPATPSARSPPPPNE